MNPYLLFKILTGCIAATFLAAGFVIIFIQYVRKKYRPSLYMSILWLGFMHEALLDTIHLILKSMDIPSALFVRFSYIFLTPGFLGVLAVVDSINRDSIETRRFAAVVFFLGINTVILFMPFEELVLSISYCMVITLGLFISSYSFVLYIKIYRNVPASLKCAAMINLLGALSVSTIYVTFNILESALPGIFPPISRLFEAVGALIQTLVFSRNEQLFYILPFKTQRLIVYDTRNGVTLFVHDWSKESQLVDEDLFSGILQGMSMIVNESIQKGHVQEIKMERGVMLINHDNMHPVAFVIIASKSSQVLHQGLDAFRGKFVQKYEAELGNGEQADQFEGATDLVRECFPFIPQFI